MSKIGLCPRTRRIFPRGLHGRSPPTMWAEYRFRLLQRGLSAPRHDPRPDNVTANAMPTIDRLRDPIAARSAPGAEGFSDPASAPAFLSRGIPATCDRGSRCATARSPSRCYGHIRPAGTPGLRPSCRKAPVACCSSVPSGRGCWAADRSGRAIARPTAPFAPRSLRSYQRG